MSLSFKAGAANIFLECDVIFLRFVEISHLYFGVGRVHRSGKIHDIHWGEERKGCGPHEQEENPGYAIKRVLVIYRI
jgi:hypothetical protein